MGRGPGIDDATWHASVAVSSTHRLPPDARVVDALTNTGYRIEPALADLIDNSIDADATRVAVRFIRTADDLATLLVLDDGSGMTERILDEAMRFGGRRRYEDDSLGMFGVGLKTASLSQADVLTVYSKKRRSTPAARQWTATGARDDWTVGIVPAADARSMLARRWRCGFDPSSHGTIIRWDNVHDFRKARGDVDKYLTKLTRAIATHLALQFHRFLSGGRLRITIQTENVETGVLGLPTEVAPLDPFSYRRPGARNWPRTLRIPLQHGPGQPIRAHIWPARSKEPGYKLGGGAVAQRQGLYIYRHDRLIQAGGWNNLRDNEPHLSLARMELDLDPRLEGYLKVRFSKSGVDASHSFLDALTRATADDGTTFQDFLNEADRVYRTRTNPRLKPVVPPGKGLRSDLGQAITRALPLDGHRANINIVWRALPRDKFFEVDAGASLLTLNKHYRAAVLQGRRASGADAPLVKALLYLLLNDNFRTVRQSALERQRLAAYQDIFIAALRGQDGER